MHASHTLPACSRRASQSAAARLPGSSMLGREGEGLGPLGAHLGAGGQGLKEGVRIHAAHAKAAGPRQHRRPSARAGGRRQGRRAAGHVWGQPAGWGASLGACACWGQG